MRVVARRNESDSSEKTVMRMSRVLQLLVTLLSAMILVGTGTAWAAYPDWPVRIVVPYPADGDTDIVDRAYIIHEGTILMEGPPEDVVAHRIVRDVYLGSQFRL